MASLTPEETAAREHIAEWLALYRTLARDLLGIRDDKDFASILGISRSHYSEIASKQSTPGIKVLLRLRREYRASIDAIFDRVPDERDRENARSSVSAVSNERRHNHAAG